MPRNGRIKSLQLGHPEPGLRDCTCGNFSEKLEVVRVDFLKHRNSSGGPNEINASACHVILHVVRAAYTVQPLNNFSRLCVDDSQPARLMLVSASNVARMGFQPAAYKQATMSCVQPRRVGYRAI